MMDWAHSGASATAAFLASLVEFVEALTIVLAVGTVRGWRPALLGAGAGTVFLILIVVVLGPALGSIPISLLQLVVGVLLLLFGMRWLRKAILRSAGIVALHDEDRIFAEQTAQLRGPAGRARWDGIAIATTFKAVVLEGIEVVFIVIAVGGVGNALAAASLGAGTALLLVLCLGLLLHRPLAKIPENTLKFAVGVMISAFGMFWVGEGLGLTWPGEDLAIIALSVLLLAAAGGAAAAARGIAAATTANSTSGKET